MIGRICIVLILAATAAAPSAVAQCLLCGERGSGALASGSGGDNTPPLAIELQSGFNFHRLSLPGPSGDVLVESKSIGGEAGLDVPGGYGLVGHVTLRGKPGAAVDILLPRSIRLIGRDGGYIDIDQLANDLPPIPQLDANGRLEFSFGGALQLPPGAQPGDYSASISINADYK